MTDTTKLHMQQTGFTLVELIMVIVIIGLLASIIVPQFVSQRVTATESATRANLENLRTAISLYFTTEGSYPTSTTLDELYDGNAPSGNTYIRQIPNETINDVSSPTATNQVVNVFDGSGGWFWDTANNELYVNVNGTDENGDLYNSW